MFTALMWLIQAPIQLLSAGMHYQIYQRGMEMGLSYYETNFYLALGQGALAVSNLCLAFLYWRQARNKKKADK